MSNRTSDGSREVLGCALGLVAAITAALTGLITLRIYQDRNKPRLPKVPEPPPDYKPAPSPRRVVMAMVVGAVLAFLAVLSLDEPNSWLSTLVLGVPGLALLGWAYFGWNAVEKEKELQRKEPAFLATPQRYIVTWPSKTKWEPEVAQRFVESLMNAVPGMAVRIVAEPGEIWWEILDWRAGVAPDSVYQTVQAYYPDAQVALQEMPLSDPEYPFFRQVLLFQHAADFVWPIQYSDDLKDFDPLTGLVQTMSRLNEGERLIYTLALSVPAPYAFEQGEKMITTSRIHPLQFTSAWGTSLALMDATSGQIKQDKYRATDQNVALSKLGRLLYQCNLAVQIDSPHADRVEQLANVDTQVWQFERPPYNALVWIGDERTQTIRRVEDADEDHQTDALATIKRCLRGRDAHWQQARLIMCSAELAALWHLPHEGFDVAHISWVKGLQRAAPKGMGQRTDGVRLGDNIYRGQVRPIHLTDHDRGMHVAVFGKTGTGKSTLLHHLVHQDIAAGHGVAVIDPHGKLVDEVLAASIPENRIQDVVLLEGGNTEYPVPLNPFRLPGRMPAVAAYNYLYWVLRKIYANIWLEGQTDRVMRNVLRTLLCDPEATPLDIQRLLVNGAYRAELMESLHEKRLRSTLMFWQSYNAQSEASRNQMAQPILNRTEAFLGSAALEYMTCHPNTLDFQSFIDERKIVLINLAGKAIQSEVDSLGALFLSGFYMAMDTLGYIADGEPPRYYLYVDEVERYVNSPIPDMFSEARKFGLSLTLVNQYLSQLSQDTLNGILGNAGTLLAFELGEKDTSSLRGPFAPELDAHALQNLGAYHVAVKTRLEGETLPAFTVHTRPPLTKTNGHRVAALRGQALRQNGFLPADAVEKWLDQRYYAIGEVEQTKASSDGLRDFE